LIIDHNIKEKFDCSLKTERKERRKSNLKQRGESHRRGRSPEGEVTVGEGRQVVGTCKRDVIAGGGGDCRRRWITRHRRGRRRDEVAAEGREKVAAPQRVFVERRSQQEVFVERRSPQGVAAVMRSLQGNFVERRSPQGGLRREKVATGRGIRRREGVAAGGRSPSPSNGEVVVFKGEGI